MIRKHSIQYILLALLAGNLAFTSCSDSMVEEKLFSQIGDGNLSDIEGARLLTNGIYGYVQYFSYFGGNNWLMNVSSYSDEFFCNWGGTPETGWGGAQNFLNMDAGHAMSETNWNSVYSLITQCNEVITKYGESTEPKIIQYVAEARFWRAFSYDKLYHLFGTVPLVTGSQDIKNGIARASQEEMESFIETELADVEKVLPETYSSTDYGRPTSWAVKATLARYYLNKKDWKKASIYAKEIIDKGGFNLVDYQDIFSKNQNDEVILAINHIAEANHGNKYVALVLEASIRDALGITGVSASNGYGMAVPFFRTFDPDDKRITPYNPATGKGIAVSGIVYKSDGTPVYGTPEEPKSVEEQLSRILTFKWEVQTNIPLGEDASLNVPALRLGEVMLTYAEAENELGHLEEAKTYVDKIRSRAGLENLPANLNMASMRDAILDERGWELYHEGYRREDLVRHGKLLEKVNEKYHYYFGKDMPWKNNNDRILQPIPTNALLLNPLLKQNPGY